MGDHIVYGTRVVNRRAYLLNALDLLEQCRAITHSLRECLAQSSSDARTIEKILRVRMYDGAARGMCLQVCSHAHSPLPSSVHTVVKMIL